MTTSARVTLKPGWICVEPETTVSERLPVASRPGTPRLSALWRAASLAAAGGALGAAAQASGDGLVGLILALLAPVPLLIALGRTGSARGAAAVGLLWGLVFFGAGLLPVGSAVGTGYAIVAAIACALFSGAIGGVALRGALVVGGDARVWRRALGVPAVAIVWVGLEWARAEFPFGLAFPWFLAGEPLVASGDLLQLAELAGPFALSFVAVAVAAAIARPSAPAAIVAVLIAGAGLGYGSGRVDILEPRLGDGPRVAAVSDVDWENVPSYADHVRSLEERRAAGEDDALAEAAALAFDAFPVAAAAHTLDAGRAGADLVVWPETSLAVSVDEVPGALAALCALARRADVDIVAGAYAGTDGAIRNTALHVGSDGELRAGFDKVRLVPIAEGLPDATRWPRLRAALDAVVPEGFEAITPGRRRDASPLVSAPDVAVTALVCYEAQHAPSAREAVARGGDIIAAVANEDRFAGTLAVALAARHARMRAVETRRPVVRCVSGAPSLLIDPLGRTTRLPDGAVRRARRLPDELASSLALRWGDRLPINAAFLAVLAFVVGLLRRPR